MHSARYFPEFKVTVIIDTLIQCSTCEINIFFSIMEI